MNMGFFKDMRNLQKQAEAMTPPEYRGMGGSMRQMRDGVAMANQTLSDLNSGQMQAQTLMATGVVGQATIGGIRDTGMTVNENPVVELDLQVTSPNVPNPYPVTHRQMINRLQVPQLQPGTTVQVRVDPMNPQSLILG
ncbi:hypothetical protein [Williamsia sp.]|uniref:hypothetical protein n=1 Tax=Williamsia sp. TaxID=1872085 RepID=UPI001A34C807|nr:hypothetical protein [Williamsia sp.]MBJ7291837.1 hypothetical protein [Williamsia sp.]